MASLDSVASKVATILAFTNDANVNFLVNEILNDLEALVGKKQ
jgi:hypothetical protein